jgi:cytosine/adenosine deaminase-related metal-dependent hydrolase
VTSVQHSGISRDFGSFEQETRDALRAYEASGLRVRYAVQARNRNSFAYEADEDFLRRLEPDLAAAVAAAAEAMGGATEDEFEALVRELIPRYDDHPRIGVLLCAEGPEWCTDDLLRRLRSLADELGAGIHLHFLESPYQREYLRREYGRPALEQLDALGLLGPDVSLAHAVWLTEADMRLCAERGVAICHNPSSNLRLRVGIAPVATMLEHGVTVALGADSTGLNDDDDLLQEMGLAARLHQLPRGLRRGPGPEPVDILRMATSDGARAIGLPDAVGRLEPGRHADLVLLDYEEISKPFLADDVDPIAALVYRARARHVDTVIVGGTPLLAGGRFTAIDEDGVHAALAASARAPVPPRIEAWMDAVRRVRPAVEAFYSGWEEPALQPAYVPNSLT